MSREYGTPIVLRLAAHVPCSKIKDAELLPDRTDEGVRRRVEGKIGAREIALRLMLPVEDRNMRFDATPHQPAEHQARTVGGVRRQRFRRQPSGS